MHINPPACRVATSPGDASLRKDPAISWRGLVKRTAASAIIAMSIAPAFAQTPSYPSCELHPHGGVAFQTLLKLRRGFNLTGWLDYKVGSRPRRPDFHLLRQLAALGFTHVRLPLTAELVMPAFAGAEVNAATFLEVDAALSTLWDVGFAVSLDLHPDGDFTAYHQSNSAAAVNDLSELWQKLAKRYAAKEADKLYFELLNEPSTEPRAWRAQAIHLIDSIRAHSPDRTIIFGPARFSRYDELIAMPRLERENIVYAVHFYDPMSFTHQGADWNPESSSRMLHDVPFPSFDSDTQIARLVEALKKQGNQRAAAGLAADYRRPWTTARINTEVAKIAAWSARERVPVIINEFGVLKAKVRYRDRLSWLRAVRGAAEIFCIGWAHWEFADGFGLVNQGPQGTSIDAGVIEALLERSMP